MQLNVPFRESSRALTYLSLSCLLAVFSLALPGMTASANAASEICIVDDGGVNDEGSVDSQLDLTQFCRNLSNQGDPDPSYEVKVVFDNITGSGSNSNDACLIFDSDLDADVNNSLCMTVGADAADGNILKFESARYYGCGDSKNDRCTQSVTDITASVFGTTDLSTICTASTQDVDPFAVPGSDYPQDTVVTCTIKNSQIPVTTQVWNLCTYPSSQPNSNPSECIISPDNYPSPVLSVSKTVTPASYSPGDTVTYTVVASSDGAIATAQLSDIFPEGTTGTWTCADGPNATCLRPSGTGDINEVVTFTGAGYITYTATVDTTGASGSLSNCATLSGSTNGAAVGCSPDVTEGGGDSLAIAKTLESNADGDSSSSITLGDVLTYSVTATNDGSTTLNNVVVTDDKISPNSKTCATLAPAATCVLTGDYTVTQADVDAGSIGNTGSVTSDEVPGPTTDVLNTPVPQGQSLAIIKALESNADGDLSGSISLGDVLTYSVTVTNDGSTTLNNVVVSDDKVSPNSKTCATLAPAATCVLTGDYTVTQADVDVGSIGNTGSVTSDEVPGPTTDVLSTPVPQAESLAIAKALDGNADGDLSGSISLGDVLTYSVTVTNDGSTTLNNVVVTDDKISPNSKTCATLAPAATCVLTGDYTVTQADVDAGSIGNTGSVTSDEVPGQTTDVLSTPVPRSESLSIVKGLDGNADGDLSGSISLGDVLTYIVTVTNDGSATLNNVVVTDDKISPNSKTCATLAPAATCVLTGDYTVTQADVDAGSIGNTGSVTSDEVPGPTTDGISTPVPRSESLSIVKGLDGNADGDLSGSISLGDVLTYIVTVTNDGSTTLNNVVVTDHKISPNNKTCATLAPAATCVLTGDYTVTQADVDAGSIGNTGSVTSDEVPGPTTDVLSTPVPQGQSLAIAKALDGNADGDLSGSITLGDVLTYSVTVTNDGSTTLSNVVVTDSKISPNSKTCATLVPAATCVLTGGYTVTQADVDAGSIGNTGSVTSDEVPGPEKVTVNTVVVQSPALTLTKTGTLNDDDGTPGLSAGDTIDYGFTVTNSGTVTVTNIEVTDPAATVSGSPILSLAPGVSDAATYTASYTLTQGDIDSGSFANTATVTGDRPAGASGDVTDSDTETIVLDESPSLEATKRASVSDTLADGFTGLGDTVTYTIDVENTGNVTLAGVSIADTFTGADGNVLVLSTGPSFVGADAGSVEGSLKVGETATYTATYVIAQAALDAGGVNNSVVASGTSPGGTDVEDTSADGDDADGNTEDDETVTGFDPVPKLTVVKSSDTSGFSTPEARVGDLIAYTMTIRNSGNLTVDSITLTDTLLGGDITSSCVFPDSAGLLLPGETATCAIDYALTESDVLAGEVVNRATAAGKAPDGSDVSDESDSGNPADDTGADNDHTVTVVEGIVLADLALDKAVRMTADNDSSGTLTPGDEATFTLSVANSGPDTALGVEVKDKLPGRYSYISDTSGGSYDESTGLWSVGELAADATASIDIKVLVRSSGDYTNRAQIIASLARDPDSSPNNDDGDQSEDDEAADPPSPAIGLAVEFGTPVRLDSGNFSLPVNIVVENTGIVDLTDIRLVEDLGAVFGADKVRIVSVPVSTGGLLANADYDGVTDTELILPSSRISGSSDAIVSMVVEVTPTPGQMTYTHNATISALSDDTDNVTVRIPIGDISTAGTEPDTNGNNGAEESEPNTITLAVEPSAGVALTASTPVPNGDGTYDTLLTVTLENQGNLQLTNVALNADLAEVFAGGYELVGTPESSSRSLIIDPAFDGRSLTNLLDSDSDDGLSSALAVGQTAVISIPVRFTPGDRQNFDLQVEALADSENGSLQKMSADGVDPGQPESITALDIQLVGQLGLAQQATPAVLVPGAPPGDMVYTTRVTLNLENLGNTPLENVQIDQLLDGVFPEGTSISIGNAAVNGDLSQLNPAFDGVVDSNILAGTQPLPLGGSATITFDVEFDLPEGTIAETFPLEATATALSPSGATVTDESDNGTEPDLDGDGPGDDADPTPVSIAPNPVVGAVQQIMDPDGDGQPVELIDAGDSSKPLEERSLTYQTVIGIDIANLGNTDLENLEVVDFLTATFPSLVEQGAVSIPAGGISIASGPDSLELNSSFDGVTDANLFNSAASSLKAGESARIEMKVDVRVDYGDEAGMQELQRQAFENRVAVNGTDPLTDVRISDLSDDATGIDLSGAEAVELVAEIDADGDFDPNEAGENEPTPIVFPSAIQGTLCRDKDGDGACAEDEEPLSGWTVAITDTAGTPLSDDSGEPVVVTVDDSGYYAVPALSDGPYVAHFSTPEGNLAGASSGLAAPLSILDLDFLIDPRGLVYNSLTGEPIEGVRLFLTNAAGADLPDVCLAANQQGQTTGGPGAPSTLGLADGEYQFLLNPAADPLCPPGPIEYRIRIDAGTVPAGFTFVSEVKAPEAAPLDASLCPDDAVPGNGRCEVSPTALPSVSGALDDYYLSFMLGVGAQDVVQNHIPMDPPLAGAVLLSKESQKSTVEVGGFAPYILTAENVSGGDLSGIVLFDTPAAGFKFSKDSALLRRAGADGLLGTADDVSTHLGAAGGRSITFDPIAIAGGERVVISYATVVGAGVRQGTHVNRAVATRGAQSLSNTATAEIDVVADPLFDLTTIIGKVFADHDEDGFQDDADATEVKLGSFPFGWNSYRVGDLKGRRYGMPQEDGSVEVLMKKGENNAFEVTTAEGTKVLVAHDGSQTYEYSGEKAAGMSSQNIVVEREDRGSDIAITIRNTGLREEGLPGARIATVGGEWITTDEFGRFSMPGVDPGENAGGRHMILKVDPVSLPDGSVFVTENPRVIRITGGLLNRMDFAVKIPAEQFVEPVLEPAQELQSETEASEEVRLETSEKVTIETRAIDLEPLHFDSGKSAIPESYVRTIEKKLDALEDMENIQNVRLVVTGNTDTDPLSVRIKPIYRDNYGLSVARAKGVADVLQSKLGISREYFVIMGCGPDYPVADNGTEEGKAANRRTDVAISYEVVLRETITREALKEEMGLEAPAADRGEAKDVGASAPTRAVVEIGESYFEGYRVSKSGLKVLGGISDALMSGAYEGLVVKIPSGEHYVNRKAAIHAHISKRLSGSNAGEAIKKLSIQPVGGERPSSAGLTGKLERIADAVLGLFVGTAHAADNVTCLTSGLCSGDGLKIYIQEAQAPRVAKIGENYLAFENGSSVWLSSAPGVLRPRLALQGPKTFQLELAEERLKDGARFWVDSNFPDYIESWKLSIFDVEDERMEEPLTEISGSVLPIGNPILWDGSVERGSLSRVDAVSYRLEALDFSGARYRTVPRTLDIVEASAGKGGDEAEYQSWHENLAARNDLDDPEISLPGALVTVEGTGLPKGGVLHIGNHSYPVGASGVLSIERHLPQGDYDIPIALSDSDGTFLGTDTLKASIEGEYFFMVGLAEATIGENDVSGNMETLAGDHRYDEDIYVDGRIAYYLKGQIRGKYLITAQLDTGEDKIEDIFKDIGRRDPSRLFKRIDPDRLYPVYGDDSTIVRDVDTQGKFYVRLDWERSRALWGNYNTGFTGTELFSYNRGMYGGKLDYRSKGKTKFNDDRTILKAFISEPDTLAAHDEFVGTGGSLYYLNHADVVLGSSKLQVEVRDTLTGRVRERFELIEGRDYEIDEFQGRILLTRPLRSSASLSPLSVVRDEPLEGDDVVLVVDYEYVPLGLADADDRSVGARAKHWFTDNVAVGLTYVDENGSDVDFEVKGVDLTLKASDETYLVVEQGSTDAAQNLDFAVSSDGGLNFESGSSPTESTDGSAISVNAQVALKDLGFTRKGKVGTWFREQDAGFDSVQFNNTSANRLKTYGLEADVEIADDLDVKGRYEKSEHGAGDEEEDSGLQVGWKVSDYIGLYTEWRSQDDLEGGVSSDSDTVGVRADWKVSDKLTAFLSGQTVVQETNNEGIDDMAGVGAHWNVTKKLNVLGEFFTGSNGDGLRAGADYNFYKGSSAYLNYVTESKDSRNQFTIGQRSELTNRLRVYTEHRFDHSNVENVEGESYGVAYDFTDDWTLETDVLYGDTRRDGERFDREAYSLTSRWNNAKLSLVNRLEYRLDESAGAADRTQWATANRVSYKYSPEWRLIGKADYSVSEEDGIADLAEYAEIDLGFAYRPLDNNRFNMLALYSFIYDLDPLNQNGGLYVDEKGHVLSVEGLYELSRRWALGGKAALKESSIRIDRDSDDFVDAFTQLYVGRLRYSTPKKWDGILEYRFLSVDATDDEKQGFLIGADYRFTDHFKAGIGYNFTDFNDDLSSLSYEAHGWFLNLMGTY